MHNGKICWFKTQNQNIMIMWTICWCLVQVWQSQIETKYNPILLHILIALPCIAELLLRVVGTNSCADKQPGQYYIIFEDPKPLNENLRCTCVYIALRRCCITSSSRAVTIKLACVHWNWTRVYAGIIRCKPTFFVCSVCFTMKRILLNSSYNNRSVGDIRKLLCPKVLSTNRSGFV